MGHLQSAGFDARITNVETLDAIKRKYGVQPGLGSCHTAIVDGYVVEGHVPAEAIRKLLEERPDVIGIAVPGMPMGSPGMDTQGRPAQNYDILTFDRDGNVKVFARR